jgi:hypothetical protein
MIMINFSEHEMSYECFAQNGVRLIKVDFKSQIDNNTKDNSDDLGKPFAVSNNGKHFVFIDPQMDPNDATILDDI